MYACLPFRTPDEQDLYDSTSQEELEEKIVWLGANIKDMVDEGQVTKDEKKQILEQIESNIADTAEALKAAEAAVAEGKGPKKAAKMVEVQTKKLSNMTARQKRIEGVDAIVHR